MRWLEGSPERYDAGMRLITFGQVAKLHAAATEAAVAEPGDRVLEIGSGTGTVTALLVARGARVTAVDQSPDMIEQARQRLSPAGETDVRWLEQTAAEVDGLPEADFDAIVISLCLSDMSSNERTFVLTACTRLLATGGRLVVADEVHAPPGLRRWAQRVWRLPQSALGWLLVGEVSRPIANLAQEIRRAGFTPRHEHRFMLGSLALIVAEVAP